MAVNPNSLWSRRGFLRLGGLTAGLTTLSRLPLGGAVAAATTADALQVLSPHEAEILTLIVERIVDSGDPAMPAVRATRTIFTIDQALLHLDPDLRGQFLWLLPIFDWSPPLMQGKLCRFSSLSPEDRDGTLRAWAESRFATCRLAFRALKNLSMLGYYAQDETWPGIHYRGPWAPRPRRMMQAAAS